MAVIGAILRAQWLSMRMGASRRGAVLSIITGFIWYGIWLVMSILEYQHLSVAHAERLRDFVPLGLLGVCFYWQAMPILSASMGSSLDLRKLRIYPIPHRTLFEVEVLLRLTTGIEMVMVMTAGVAALFRNPYTRGWYALAAFPLFILFNLLLASGTRSLLERLLSKRRVREAMVFVFFLLWMVPRFLFLTGHGPRNVRGLNRAIESLALPWTAAADLALGVRILPALLYLAAWICLAAWFGRMQFERNLRFDMIAAQAVPLSPGKSRFRNLIEAFYRWPSMVLRDPLGAIVEKELRSLARTPRYRMVFVMGFSFGLMVWLPMIMGSRADRSGGLSAHFLTVVCVYALTLLGQVSYWNTFGFDRSAVQIYFAAPQPLRATLIGKNIASLTYIYLEVAILSAITTAFKVNVGVPEVVETLLVVGVCALYMLSMGNIASVQYPRGLNPSRVSHGGATGRFQALVFLLYPLAMLPVGLAYLARFAFESQVVFYAALAFAAVIGGVLYWIAMDSAVTTAIERREKIIQDLSSADGPITE
jgi:ABC-2 type transport system permease protein